MAKKILKDREAFGVPMDVPFIKQVWPVEVLTFAASGPCRHSLLGDHFTRRHQLVGQPRTHIFRKYPNNNTQDIFFIILYPQNHFFEHFSRVVLASLS
jgi:hypothetical protein